MSDLSHRRSRREFPEAYAGADTGQDTAEDALEAGEPAVIGERRLSDHERWNEADRPGENAYIGFDLYLAADDLSADWEARVDQAAIDTVRTVTERQRAAAKKTAA